MSSTRINQDGEFKQSRFASSPELDRALKANLIAARCSTLALCEQREAIWFIQYLSQHPGGLAWAAAEVAPNFIADEDRETYLASVCLDPAENQELKHILPEIQRLMTDYTRKRSEGVAITQIGSTINDALDYCSAQKCLVMISGRPRMGKTFAARQWVETHPGRARYCEVPSSADDITFFMELARAMGITIESTVKRIKLQPRIEAALRTGDLTLILDESANLWPSQNHRPPSRPGRVSWVMQMINSGVPIALLVTPNFFAGQQDYLEKSRWNDAQFYGRIERFIQLPETMPASELEKVARAWLPKGDRRSIEVLADAASLSQKYLSTIEHTVKLALHFAKQAGRERPEWQDIHRALYSGVQPGDKNLATALKGADAARNITASLAR